MRGAVTRRGVCALLGTALGLVAAATAMLSSPTVHAVSEGPDAQAWWSITNQGLGVDPGVPSDVKPADLYLAGLAGDRKVPVSAPSPFPSGIGDRGLAAAIAAMRFTIPPGGTIDKLTLQFDGAAPPAVDVLACRTTQAFLPEHDGPWNDVPPYDCSVPSAGALSTDGSALVFGDIAALRSGTTLSFVIVPQFADRLVLAKPDNNALSMRAPLPTFGSGGPPPPVPAVAVPPASTFNAASPLTAPVAAPALHPAAPAPTAPPPAPPQASASSAAVATAQPAAAAVPGIDDARARIAASLFLAAALISFLALTASDAAWLGRLFGVRAARLAPAAAQRARGVGRFARPRDGRPESL
jgi:hypothetical protein